MPSMTIGGYDLSTINWSYVAYIIFAILVMGLGSMQLYSPETLVRLIIFLVGGILVFVFFSMRWFGNTNTPSAVWPPTINMCPDYLTYVPSIKASRSDISPTGGCIDLLGVSTGGLVRTNRSEINTVTHQDTSKVFKYTGITAKATTKASEMQALCDMCARTGLTWEGIYDGEICQGLARFMTVKKINAGTCGASIT